MGCRRLFLAGSGGTPMGLAHRAGFLALYPYLCTETRSHNVCQLDYAVCIVRLNVGIPTPQTRSHNTCQLNHTVCIVRLNVGVPTSMSLARTSDIAVSMIQLLAESEVHGPCLVLRSAPSRFRICLCRHTRGNDL